MENISSVTRKAIDDYTTSYNKIATLFVCKYFEAEDVNIESEWTVSGRILYYADRYVDINDMIYCLENGVPIDKFFEWDEWNIDNYPTEISLDDFCLGAKKVKQKEKEQLKVLKENVEFAKKELEKAMDEWDITLTDGIDE